MSQTPLRALLKGEESGNHASGRKGGEEGSIVLPQKIVYTKGKDKKKKTQRTSSKREGKGKVFG